VNRDVVVLANPGVRFGFVRALALLSLLLAGCGIKGPPRSPLAVVAPPPAEAPARGDADAELGMQPDAPAGLDAGCVPSGAP